MKTQSLKLKISLLILIHSLFSCNQEDVITTTKPRISTGPPVTNIRIDRIFSRQSNIEAGSRDQKTTFTAEQVAFIQVKTISGTPAEEIHFAGQVFVDNGQGHDPVANDGIYASVGKWKIERKGLKSIPAYWSYFDRSKLQLSTARIGTHQYEYLDPIPDYYIPTGVEPVISPDWYVKCKFEISRPGEKCLSHTCPKTSLFGGKTLICICAQDCEFCFGTSCS